MEKTRLTAVVKKDGKWYVAECVELGIATQSENMNKAVKELKEACELYLNELSENPDVSNTVVFTKLEELPPEE